MAISNIYKIEGDILTADQDYLVQQCCCTAVRGAGLSKAIATSFPDANPYANRRPMKKGGNTALSEDRATPGTSLILGKRKIACLFAQYAQGKPGANEVPDAANDRLRYFETALIDLISKIPTSSSLAIPYKIGCGLAGGNWSDYKRVLRKMAAANPTLSFVIYQLP